MSFESTLDPVAVYAAVVSTLLAVGQFYRWLTGGPAASVTILNPLEVRRHEHSLLEVVVSNAGAAPIIVREVCVSYAERRKGAALKTVLFNAGAGWNPSLRDDPHPTKAATTFVVPNVIAPGHEHHQLLRPFSDFNPTLHWLRAEVRLRNSNKRFSAYAAPVVGAGTLMRARSVTPGSVSVALAMLGVLAWLIARVPAENGIRKWTGSLNPGGWMAWTFPTALFFWVIAALLLTFTWAAIRYPEVPRKGVLGILTTRGDRLFISLLGAAFVNLAWLGFGGAPVWGGLALSLIYAAAVFRWV